MRRRKHTIRNRLIGSAAALALAPIALAVGLSTFAPAIAQAPFPGLVISPDGSTITLSGIPSSTFSISTATGDLTLHNLSIVGTCLLCTGTGITSLTGDVTAGPGSASQVATIPAGTVTGAKIAAATVAGSNMVANTVDYARQAQAVANTLSGNPTGSTANKQDIGVPSCPAPGSLAWTSGSGFSCVTGAGKTLIAGSSVAAGTVNNFIGLAAAQNVNALVVSPIVMPFAGTLKNLRFGGGNVQTAGTVVVNTGASGNTPSGVTCALSSVTQCSDSTHTVAVAAGDLVTLQFSVGLNPGAETVFWSVELDPT